MMAQHVALERGADLAGFRQAVRVLLARAVPPDAVAWSADSATPDLSAAEVPDRAARPALSDEEKETAAPVTLPRAVAKLIETVVCHRNPARYALLYQLVWRVRHGEPHLLEVHSDPLVSRLEAMDKAIRRDLHKMHAFLRFRRVEGANGSERFVAWFEPAHFILEAAADFFITRFRGMAWSILTPDGSLHWDRKTLTIGPPGTRAAAPDGDDFEPAWRGYYESTFNPARVNPKAMRTEMPKKYWANMPETQAIPGLVRAAQARAAGMVARPAQPMARRDPQRAVAAMADQGPATLEALNAIIAAAEPFVAGGTRAVTGEGPMRPAIAFVGEQPGDQEDLQGRPFVGPAGQLLDRALAEAGIERSACFLTNAVKHFKYVQRGKRRLHQKPTAGEVSHYRWWLNKELEFVRPGLVVALGATAVLALTGRSLAITHHRGPAQLGGWPGFITVHPSYLLRVPEERARQQAYADFVADLGRAAALAPDARQATHDAGHAA